MGQKWLFLARKNFRKISDCFKSNFNYIRSGLEMLSACHLDVQGLRKEPKKKYKIISGNPSLKKLNWNFDLTFHTAASNMPVAENPSGMPQILSKVFQLYLNKSGDTFRYLEHVIWMPRGFINNQNKNMLPTKLQGLGRRKRVLLTEWKLT